MALLMSDWEKSYLRPSLPMAHNKPDARRTVIRRLKRWAAAKKGLRPAFILRQSQRQKRVCEVRMGDYLTLHSGRNPADSQDTLMVTYHVYSWRFCPNLSDI